jgi:16S rRNA (adenine1518-N6/adenine1519-N6)-dimethyltransferase
MVIAPSFSLFDGVHGPAPQDHEHEGLMSIRALLNQYNLRPNKKLGQNFLVDPVHLARIVAAGEVRAGDTVVEIGPGLGALTELLLGADARVAAVELDRGFIRVLTDRFGSNPNFRLSHADILGTKITDLLGVWLDAAARYKVVANIPYYITSAVIRHLLENDDPTQPRPELLVLLMQKEVAQRIVAAPGDLSLLAISVQFYGEPEVVGTVPAGAFYPAPKVDSAILKVRPYSTPRYDVQDLDFFWQVVKAGFGQKRKQLKNSLNAGLGASGGAAIDAALSRAGISPTRRAQTLTIGEWAALTNHLASRQS